jgi:subtilisin-like proprotein convertase family protein
LSAWQTYTGKGVIVAVNDDGVDLTHPSLAANLLVDLAYDSVRNTTGQGFVGAGNSHGTVVGSIVGMAGNDGIGGVGVAFEAKIVPGLAIAAGSDTSRLFLANLAAGAAVSVNSWGQDPAFAENFGASGSASDIAWGAALLRAATEARGGLGMVIEVSGGNERQNAADTALSNFTNNKLTISVGAITEEGKPTSYSTPGASLLVTAPGGTGAAEQSVDSGFGIASADIQGNAGYNKTDGAAGDYAYQNQGTSYSGPMVGGAAALMLQANPKLGFRDVSNILAATARRVDGDNPSWVANKAGDWNLSGMHFSRDFGFGLLDVSAAVRLAESWSGAAGTIANWQSAEGASATPAGAIPDADPTGLTATAVVAGNVRIERMEFDLNLTATSPSQLSATITSPSGTTVTLFDQPLTRNLVEGVPDRSQPENPWPATFTIGSTAFLGESSAGQWTLKLTDKVTGEIASFTSLTVRAWGSAASENSQYVLTDEFSGTNVSLTDLGGVDTLNAAALSTTVLIDLGAGQRSTVGSGSLTIASGTVIENAIGGLGADTLIGNAGNNLLRGNGGNDSIDGGAGLDTAIYTSARADYAVARGPNGIIVTDNRGFEGVDSLAGIERLLFSDRAVGFDVDGSGGKAYRLYQAAFNRTPDQGGVGFWIYHIDRGFGLVDAATNFIGSAEFTGLYGANPSNNDFTRLLYRNVLHRDPDQGGYDFWNGALNSGFTRAQTLAQFSESPENQAAVVGVISNGFDYQPFAG